MASEVQVCLLENGGNYMKPPASRHGGHSRMAHNVSSSSLRRKSDISAVSNVRYRIIGDVLANLHQVFLGTKLCILFVTVPLAIIAHYLNFTRSWIFGLSLIGLTPLAERISFLTEQITFYTGPTVGGLLNATCGNATELIIAIFALANHKVDVVKYSLIGSILSNLLLVLGTSLLCGGILNISSEQRFDRKQADVNSLLLLLGLICHVLPLMFQYVGQDPALIAKSTLALSRASCVVMLLAYIGYLVFQLWTHRQFFEAEEEDGDRESEEEPVLGFWSSFVWLALMTAIVALLSEYVVATIEDISLGVALGSSTQIAMFVVPLCVIVAWMIGINMDLNFGVLEISSLALSIITVAFALQDGTSHYMKGLVLVLCYIVIGVCFFVNRGPSSKHSGKLFT
nr:vacuolar cation/proton exchanger 3 [Ipomoea batatas]